MTTASDIYSLGVLLYELLTGHRPYIIDTQQPAEIERIVCETDPERPSTAVTRERESSGAEPGAARPAPRRRLRRELAGDLDNIVLMAMRKEPERRYASVEQLSEDVRSHLRGFPVIARADSTAYRVSKFVRRHSLVLGALVAVFAALVIGLTMSISQHREAVRQRLVAEEKTREAQWEAYTNSIAAGEASVLMNQIGDARSQLDDAPKHLRGWEWSHLEARLDRSVYVRDTHRRGITRIAFMPDGTAFATASMDGSVGLWQTASGDSVRRWSDLSSGAESVAISPDGTLIAAGLNDGTVIVWDTAAGNEVARLSGRKWAMVAFSPDGRRLGAGFQEGEFIEWQTAGWQKLGTIETGTGFVCPVYTRDGNSVLLGDHSGRVGVWNLTRRRRTMDIAAHGRRVMNMALSGDGTLLATASMDRTAKIWRLSDGELVTVFRGHHATVAGIAFLNNEHVISTGADRAIFVWNANDGTVTAELRGGGEDAYSLAVSPDSASIVTGSWAGRVRLWARNTEDVRTLRIPQPSYEQFPASDAGVSPDGSLVASAAGRSQVCLWDARTGEHLEAMQTGRSDFTTCVVFGRNGSRIYAGDAGGHIIVFDTNTRRRLLAFAAHGSAVRGLDVSPDGTRLVSASEDSTIRFWDAALLAPRGELRGRVSQTDVVFGPQDGMASGSQDGTIRLWNTGSGDTTHVLRAHTAEITALAYSPDGGALASASKDETVRVWDATTGASLGVLATGRGRSTAVCFTPDGTRIAVGGGDQIVRILDPLTRRELSYLHGHVGRILALVPDPVRNGIVSASYDGTVRLWDAE